MSKPVKLSKDELHLKASKKDHKNEKVTEAGAIGIPALHDIPFVELPTAGRLELPPPFTFPIHVISMNVSGPNDGYGTASRRKQFIAEVVLTNDPHILLFQEFQWQGIRGRAWKDTHLPDRYAYTGNNEASVMYDTERFDLKELAQTKLQAPLDELKRTGKVSQDFTPLARSCIRLMETKGLASTDTFKVLVVSWHGVHSGMKEAEKKAQFQYLQVYLKELSERQDAAILLGGDFNIKMSLIRSLVLPKFILYEYTPSKRRKANTIDYFMASPALSLTDIEYIDLAKENHPKGDTTQDTKTQDPYRVLDHDPVSATVVRSEARKTLVTPGPVKLSALDTLVAIERAS